MNERDELSEVIANFRDDWYKIDRKAPAGIDRDEAAHILAAGYRKQDVVIEWGAAHANGVVARTYRTERAAQAFVKSMAEVEHEMKVLRREYRPATYTEWEPQP